MLGPVSHVAGTQLSTERQVSPPNPQLTKDPYLEGGCVQGLGWQATALCVEADLQILGGETSDRGDPRQPPTRILCGHSYYYYLKRSLQPARGQGAAPLGGGHFHQHGERVGPEQGQKAGVRCRGTAVTGQGDGRGGSRDALEKGTRTPPLSSSPPSPSTSTCLPGQARLQAEVGAAKLGGGRGRGADRAGPNQCVS